LDILFELGFVSKNYFLISKNLALKNLTHESNLDAYFSWLNDNQMLHLQVDIKQEEYMI
jgi:hypothetical protein